MAADQETLKRAEMKGFGGITNRLGTDILQYLFNSGKSGVVCVTPIDWSRAYFDWSFLSNFKSYRPQLAKLYMTTFTKSSYQF